MELLFPALKFIESCDADTEAATEEKNRKFGDRR
jgi:hypothetical protein